LRLDNYIVENSLADSRNKAQTLIKDGQVLVNSKAILKPSFKVEESDSIEVNNHLYVSRAAQKLSHFLPLLDFKVEGMKALDIGSSTGGFCEVLLNENITSIDAVDVGSEQLHEKIKSNEKVTSYEQTDIRTFESETEYDLITCDVSFISLHNILDAIDKHAKSYMILLFKPQFEVGKEAKRDKNGVIKNFRDTIKAMDAFELEVKNRGWSTLLKDEASIAGKEGNVEYCYCFKK